MTKPLMFDPDATLKHIGDKIKFSDKLTCLDKVEEYFRSKCEQERIEYSYDCTANENTFYDTLNYTTYAGLFIMHPLCYSEQMFQMYDAKADGLSSAGHIEWVDSNLKSKANSKYVKSNDEVLDTQQLDDYKAVVVLPGSNKIYEHTSSQKLKDIIKRHGTQSVMKPHPITSQAVLDDLENIKGDSQLADPYSNLYDILKESSLIYTSHISETALTGLLLGKRISPMERFENRLTGSFSHINHFCFSEPYPVHILKSIFASPKSGVIHPDIDKDWRSKMDKYFEYTLTRRKLQLGHYCE